MTSSARHSSPSPSSSSAASAHSTIRSRSTAPMRTAPIVPVAPRSSPPSAPACAPPPMSRSSTESLQSQTDKRWKAASSHCSSIRNRSKAEVRKLQLKWLNEPASRPLYETAAEFLTGPSLTRPSAEFPLQIPSKIHPTRPPAPLGLTQLPRSTDHHPKTQTTPPKKPQTATTPPKPETTTPRPPLPTAVLFFNLELT